MKKDELTTIIAKVELSHKAIAETISAFGAEVKENNKKMQDARIESATIVAALNGINNKLEKFVTQDQFAPVRNIVYGAVTIILTAVIVGGVALLIGTGSSKITTQADVISN